MLNLSVVDRLIALLWCVVMATLFNLTLTAAAVAQTPDEGLSTERLVTAQGIPRLGHPAADRSVLDTASTCTANDLTPSGTVTGTEQFNACQTITAADFTVASGAVVTFRAGQRITLNPGFRVQAGGRFTAGVGPLGLEEDVIFTGGEAFAPDDNLAIATFSSAVDSDATDLSMQASVARATPQTFVLGQTQSHNEVRWLSQFTPDCDSASENGFCGFAAVLMGADYLLDGQTNPPAPANIGYGGDTPGWLYDTVEHAFGAGSSYLNCGGPVGIYYSDIPNYAEALGLYDAVRYQGLSQQTEQWITAALASDLPVLALVPYQGMTCSGRSGISQADFYAGGSITREMMPCDSIPYRHWVLVAGIDQDSVLVYDSDPFATSSEAGIRRYSKTSFFDVLPDTRPNRSGQPVMFKLCPSAEACDSAPEAFSTVASIELGAGHTYTADQVTPVVNPLVSQYAFSAVGLPMGLTMDTEGRIVGVTSLTGVFYPTITLRSVVNGVERIATWVMELIINPDAQAELQFITKSQLPGARVGHFYLQLLSTTPTLEPVSFSHAGNLPPGLLLLDRMITGIPLSAGEWSFTIQASTPALNTTKTFSIRVDSSSAPAQPTPILESTEPETLLTKDGEQRLLLRGSQFSEDARVELQNVTDDADPFIKMPESITPTEISLRADFSSNPADWQAVVINRDGVKSQPVEFSVVAPSDTARLAVWPSAWTPVMDHLLQVTANYGAFSLDCPNVDDSEIWRYYVGSRSEHLGLDLRGSAGTTVKAIAPGKVLASGPSSLFPSWGAGWGDVVLIEHWTTLGEVFTAVYGHIDSSVSTGTTVQAGTELGTIYNLSSGSHLHFGIARGRHADDVLPMTQSPGDDACLPSPGITVDPEGFLNTRLPADSPPDTATPLSPTGAQPGTQSQPGPTLSSTTVTLSWSASSGANYYEIGVRDLGSSELVVNTTTTETSLTVDLSPDRAYRWNMRACNGAGCSSYTPRLYFQTLGADPGDTGNLQVTITPPEAVDAGAQWRRANTNPWFDSGSTETGIPVGGQTVEFKVIPNWTAPNNAAVSITAGQTTVLTRSYEAETTDPVDPIDPPPPGTSRLNDTGIDWCADGDTNFLACPVALYPGQDGDYGRDAAARAGTLDKVGDGAAGFDYTKLDADGNDLPASALNWSCVRDNHTGLIWEVKVDDPGHLRHKDHIYTWYNPDPDTNGGSAGTATGTGCNGTLTGGCNTHAFVQAVNAQGLCGASDWRMPTVDELHSLTHQGRVDPAIDTDYFPHTSPSHFWSASPYAGGSDGAWSVLFYNGYDTYWYESGYNRVRLVRGGQ